MNVGVCTVCIPSGASPALLACVAPAAVPRAGLHSWGEPWGRAAAWCTSPYPLFYLVSSHWAPLSDSTCNYTVTFLHLLLHPHPSLTLHHHWSRHKHRNSTTDTNVLHVCMTQSHTQNTCMEWRCKCSITAVLTCPHLIALALKCNFIHSSLILMPKCENVL